MGLLDFLRGAPATDVDRRLAEATQRADAWQAIAQQHAAEKRLLIDMLTARTHAHADAETLRQVNVILERHTASAKSSNAWAIAHINLLTHERNALLAQRGIQLPNAEFQQSDADQPPPGPVALEGLVGGLPIPEGKTAGDVIAALRLRRDRERAQTPVDPADLLKQAADIFNEPSAGDPGASDNEPPLTDPFADIP